MASTIQNSGGGKIKSVAKESASIRGGIPVTQNVLFDFSDVPGRLSDSNFAVGLKSTAGTHGESTASGRGEVHIDGYSFNEETKQLTVNVYITAYSWGTGTASVSAIVKATCFYI